MKYLLLLISITGFSQLHHQTIGAGGGSTRSGVVYSVGQASVVGNHSSQEYNITQGYVQPLKNAYFLEIPQDNFHVAIYPNPFIESFEASFDKEFSSIRVIIQNTLGQTIYHKSYTNQSQINVKPPNLSSQTYLVTILADDKTYKAKLIKESTN